MLEASENLLELYKTLRGGADWIPKAFEIPKAFGCLDADLEIFAPHYPLPLPKELRAFLVETMPQGYLDIGILKTYGPRELLNEQLGAVPFYGNMGLGFFGLGWWTGNSDGDGWLCDLDDLRVYAVSLSHNYDNTRETLIRKAYLQFDSLAAWVAYLKGLCREYGWIEAT